MDLDERARVADQFGVAPEQVERDHLISYILGFLSERFGRRIHFIGGTALARTHLPSGRLSEDVDLVSIDSRSVVAEELDAALPRSVARSHGRLALEPSFARVADTVPVTARTADGVAVKIQLLSSRHRIVWPSERRPLEQRYSDAPTAELVVPTLPAFVASKTATWADRSAPRDLWDLWALSGIGAIDRVALDLFKKFGPTNRPPSDHIFNSTPSDAAWRTQLAGQTRLTVTAAEAIKVVRDAWARISGGG
ncbi:nucleotidyl transferase AbiEii/AbiGii toxin family protein [Mycobacterium sp. 852002-10029_SCH5224772]|uniref:nucleotidyl transferase AbiEii/AbiGii toxin family protein n=1 Tax=Mycobacterium sp. 852002-10029_SCH5224772 TaxID=1834083 RepID=UPI0009ED0309|nr:nucleotidyl transferase AbiEii/AbiGii toxin family protein [Mycobacterium sp. 852002-10029_SCH5224772]